MPQLMNTGRRPEGGCDRYGSAFVLAPGETRFIAISEAYETQLRRRGGALRVVVTADPPREPAGERQNDQTPPAGDDLTRIKGIGDAVAGKLAEAGITTIAQIAELTPEAAAELNVQLNFRGDRIGRDEWVEQARALT